MSSGGGGSTVVQQSGPPPQVMQAYQDLTLSAAGEAQQPLNLYSGPLVAGFTPQQQAGFQTIDNAQGIAAPYINAGAQEFGAATTPLWPTLPQLGDTAMSGLGAAGTTGIGTGATQAGTVAGTASGVPGAIGGYTQPISNTSNYLQDIAQTMPTNTAGFTQPIMGTAAGLQPGVAPSTGFASGQAANVAGIGNALPGNVPTYGDLSTYFNPYTQQVTQATQALFDQQNAQQLEQVRGSATQQGAYGGDREAVAEALTAQQQQLAEAPTIGQLQATGFAQQQQELNAQQQEAIQQAQTQAGIGTSAGQLALGSGGLGLQAGTSAGQLETAGGQLYLGGTGQAIQAGQAANQGFGTAGQLYLGGTGQAIQGGLGAGQLGLAAGQAGFGEYNTQQQQQLAAEQANAWLQSQAGFGISSLGQEAQSTALTGAQAELGVGGMQQQLAQEELNIPYQEFQAEQAYPYQQLSFLAPIVEGTGSLAGGTGSTTYPGPSPISQVAGLGTAAAGLSGLFGGGGGGGSLGSAGFSSGGGDFGGGSDTISPVIGKAGGRFYAGGGRIGRDHFAIGGSSSPGQVGAAAYQPGFVPQIDSGIPNPLTSLNMIPTAAPQGSGATAPGLAGNLPNAGTFNAQSGGGGGGASGSSGNPLSLLSQGVGLAKGIGGLFGGIGGAADLGAAAGAADAAAAAATDVGAGAGLDALGALAIFKGGGRARFQSGGSDSSEIIPGASLMPIEPPSPGGGGTGPYDLPRIPNPAHSGVHPGPVIFHGPGPPKSPSGGPTAPGQQGLGQQAQGLSSAAGKLKSSFGSGSSSDTAAADTGSYASSSDVPDGGDYGGGDSKSGGHIHRAYGGGYGAQSSSAGVPLGVAIQYGGASPNIQGQYQQLLEQPESRLQQMQVQFPASTPQGQLIERAIAAKHATVGSGTAGVPPGASPGGGQQMQIPQIPYGIGSSGSAGGTASLGAPPQDSGGTSHVAKGGQPETEDKRGYVTADELDPHPVVDHSGKTVVVNFASEGKKIDLGLPPIHDDEERPGYAAGGSAGNNAASPTPTSPIYATGASWDKSQSAIDPAIQQYSNSSFVGDLVAPNSVALPQLNTITSPNGSIYGNSNTVTNFGPGGQGILPGGGIGNWNVPIPQDPNVTNPTGPGGSAAFPSALGFTPGMSPIVKQLNPTNPISPVFGGPPPAAPGAASATTPAVSPTDAATAAFLGIDPSQLAAFEANSSAAGSAGSSGGGGKRGGRFVDGGRARFQEGGEDVAAGEPEVPAPAREPDDSGMGGDPDKGGSVSLSVPDSDKDMTTTVATQPNRPPSRGRGEGPTEKGPKAEQQSVLYPPTPDQEPITKNVATPVSSGFGAHRMSIGDSVGISYGDETPPSSPSPRGMGILGDEGPSAGIGTPAQPPTKPAAEANIPVEQEGVFGGPARAKNPGYIPPPRSDINPPAYGPPAKRGEMRDYWTDLISKAITTPDPVKNLPPASTYMPNVPGQPSRGGIGYAGTEPPEGVGGMGAAAQEKRQPEATATIPPPIPEVKAPTAPYYRDTDRFGDIVGANPEPAQRPQSRNTAAAMPTPVNPEEQQAAAPPPIPAGNRPAKPAPDTHEAALRAAYPNDPRWQTPGTQQPTPAPAPKAFNAAGGDSFSVQQLNHHQDWGQPGQQYTGENHQLVRGNMATVGAPPKYIQSQLEINGPEAYAGKTVFWSTGTSNVRDPNTHVVDPSNLKDVDSQLGVLQGYKPGAVAVMPVGPGVANNEEINAGLKKTAEAHGFAFVDPTGMQWQQDGIHPINARLAEQRGLQALQQQPTLTPPTGESVTAQGAPTPQPAPGEPEGNQTPARAPKPMDVTLRGEQQESDPWNSANRGQANDTRPGTYKLTEMTVGQIMQSQLAHERGDPNGIFAAGRPQIIPETMRDVVKAGVLDPNEKYTPEAQTRAFEWLMTQKPGREAIGAYITGQSNDLRKAQFQLGQEWTGAAGDPNTGPMLDGMRAAYANATKGGATPQDAMKAAFDADIQGVSVARLGDGAGPRQPGGQQAGGVYGPGDNRLTPQGGPAGGFTNTVGNAAGDYVTAHNGQPQLTPEGQQKAQDIGRRMLQNAAPEHQSAIQRWMNSPSYLLFLIGAGMLSSTSHYPGVALGQGLELAAKGAQGVATSESRIQAAQQRLDYTQQRIDDLEKNRTQTHEFQQQKFQWQQEQGIAKLQLEQSRLEKDQAVAAVNSQYKTQSLEERKLNDEREERMRQIKAELDKMRIDQQYMPGTATENGKQYYVPRATAKDRSTWVPAGDAPTKEDTGRATWVRERMGEIERNAQNDPLRKEPLKEGEAQAKAIAEYDRLMGNRGGGAPPPAGPTFDPNRPYTQGP